MYQRYRIATVVGTRAHLISIHISVNASNGAYIYTNRGCGILETDKNGCALDNDGVGTCWCDTANCNSGEAESKYLLFMLFDSQLSIPD